MNTWTTQRRKIFAHFRVWLVLCASVLVISCGHANSPFASKDFNPDVVPDADLGDTSSLEDLLFTEGFNGQLIVHVGGEVSSSKAVSPSSSLSLSDVATLVSDHNATVSPLLETDPVQLDDARTSLEKVSGKTLQDWNQVYRIQVTNPNDAVRILRDLKKTRGVSNIYPQFRPSPSDITTTADLSGEQPYLTSLEAPDAWSLGVTGSGVNIYDNEHGMNFLHEDLGLILDDEASGGSFHDQPECAPGLPMDDPLACEPSIAHGTAVAGILVGQNNDHGVKGFAYDARLVLAPMLGGIPYTDLLFCTDGIDTPSETHLDDDCPPGSIFLIEVQMPGPLSDGSCSGDAAGQYGCVPTECDPLVFAAIEQATAFGVTVIAGAGNGSMNLNDDSAWEGDWSFGACRAGSDPGSVLVGASNGEDRSAASWSNHGTRVNSFAWGAGVVTTAYPDSNGVYIWEGGDQPGDSDNNWYTNRFGGTSSATAMVAGVAALVQSDAKTQLSSSTRYLMPTKMRDILTSTGVTQTSGNPVGTEPRALAAIEASRDFIEDILADYPELTTNSELSEDQLTDLRADGVGVLCNPTNRAGSDPSCPDSILWPTGKSIGCELDVDGDCRADLITSTNDEVTIDLSSQGDTPDKFGSIDLTITFPAITGRWVVPYFADYNSDGRTDLLFCRKDDGECFLKYTTRSLLEGDAWTGWDDTIDYDWTETRAMDPWDSTYCRLVPGNYDGDLFFDIATFCSDGFWRIDYQENGWGNWDYSIKILSDEQLAAVPGWAYVPAQAKYSSTGAYTNIAYRHPEGCPDSGRLTVHSPPDYRRTWDDFGFGLPMHFEGNATVLVPGRFLSSSGDVGLKRPDGSWEVVDGNSGDYGFEDIVTLDPDGIFGGPDCHPVVGDFDGDDRDDRAVSCEDAWTIAYSGEEYADLLDDDTGARVIALPRASQALNGRAYAGGISMDRVWELITFAQEQNPDVAPPIPVDMVTTSSCLSTSDPTRCD